MAEQKTPFGQGSTGANAFKNAYDRLKQQSELQKQNIGQNYSDVYQKLRNQQYAQGLGAAAQAGLSGGQASTIRQKLGAAQMGELSNLAQSQNRALREQSMSDASIYSNALFEGQQSQDMENNRLAQISGILTTADGKQKDIDSLTNIELQQLEALGYKLSSSGTSGGYRTDRSATRQTAMEDVGPFGINANKIENRYRAGELTYQQAFDLLKRETTFGGGLKYTDQQITNRLRRDGFKITDIFKY
jgi:hypothetical protein